MKQKLILALFMLSLGIISAQAQGAGLSYGEAVKAPAPTTTKAKKTCPNCGIIKGNITYPWQHESWCPHYRSQGGGSSSSRSSSSSSGAAYTAASAATSVLGSLLSGMISSGSNSTSSPKPQRTPEEIKKSRELHYRALQHCIADEKFWNVGDYAVVKGDQKIKYLDRKCISYGIKNTKTGNYVINPFNSKPNKGDCILFRGMKDVTAGNTFRLYEPPAGDPTGKPFVICYPPPYKWEISSNGKGDWSRQGFEKDWYQINDQDQLERLKEVKLEEVYKSTGCYYINRGGKVGVYVLAWFGDNYTYDSNGLATGFVSQDIRVDMIIPVKYDSIIRKGSFYHAIKADGFDLYDAQNLKQANPGLKKYDELTKIYHVNWKLEALQNGKYGLVDYEGRVMIPFIYNSREELKKVEGVKHNSISYTLWYKNEAFKYIDKKGEFEKTDHFEARMKDAKMQEEYLREVMADAPQRYLAEKVPNKENLKLTLGEYDADKECFPISLAIAPWNIFMLPVPIADAKEFKTEFESIKASATKTAQLGIRYDAPSIESITFTTNSGKKYKYGE